MCGNCTLVVASLQSKHNVVSVIRHTSLNSPTNKNIVTISILKINYLNIYKLQSKNLLLSNIGKGKCQKPFSPHMQVTIFFSYHFAIK